MRTEVSSFRIACAVVFGIVLISFACFVARNNMGYCPMGFGRTTEKTTFSIGNYYTCEEVRDMILLGVFPFPYKTKEKIKYFCKGELEDVSYYDFYVSDYIFYYRQECLK